MVKNINVILNAVKDLKILRSLQNYIRVKHHGFSTVEILISTAILVIVFSAVVLLVMGSQKMSIDTETAHEAQLLNSKLLEEARAASLANFNSDVTIDPAVQESGTIYYKKRTQNFVSECVKEIYTRVDWTTEGRAQYVENTTQVSSPQAALALGTECRTGTPPGTSFEQCTLYGSDSLEGPDQDAYDLDVTRINGQKHVFIATHPKNGQQAPEDLWIYNTQNEADPNLAAKININNNNQVGVNAVVVVKIGSSYYAYVGNDQNSNQLIVVNVTNTATPGLPIPINLTGTGNNVVTDLAYYNGKLYVAIGNDVKVFTLSNPELPTLQSSINFGGTVNKISFNSNYLYAATADNLGELSRANLSTLAVTKYNLNGNASNKPATSIDVLGTRIYLGLQTGQNENNFYIIDDKASGFTIVASHNMPHQNNKKVIDHVVVGDFVFALVESANKEFQVYDLSNPAVLDDRCTSTNPTNVGYGLDYFEDFVYLSMRSNQELQIFTESN